MLESSDREEICRFVMMVAGVLGYGIILLSFCHLIEITKLRSRVKALELKAEVHDSVGSDSPAVRAIED